MDLDPVEERSPQARESSIVGLGHGLFAPGKPVKEAYGERNSRIEEPPRCFGHLREAAAEEAG